MAPVEAVKNRTPAPVDWFSVATMKRREKIMAYLREHRWVRRLLAWNAYVRCLASGERGRTWDYSTKAWKSASGALQSFKVIDHFDRYEASLLKTTCVMHFFLSPPMLKMESPFLLRDFDHESPLFWLPLDFTAPNICFSPFIFFINFWTTSFPNACATRIKIWRLHLRTGRLQNCHCLALVLLFSVPVRNHFFLARTCRAGISHWARWRVKCIRPPGEILIFSASIFAGTLLQTPGSNEWSIRPTSQDELSLCIEKLTAPIFACQPRGWCNHRQ